MSSEFFESIYKSSLRDNLRKSRMSEMARASKDKVNDFMAKNYPDYDIYKNYMDPARKVKGSPEDKKWNEIVDAYGAAHPEDFNVGSKKTWGAAIADVVHPEAHKRYGAKNPEDKLENVISAIKRAQTELDMAGFGDSDAANKIMDLLTSLDTLKGSTPAETEAPKSEIAKDEVKEPEIETPEDDNTEVPEPSIEEPEDTGITPNTELEDDTEGVGADIDSGIEFDDTSDSGTSDDDPFADMSDAEFDDLTA